MGIVGVKEKWGQYCIKIFNYKDVMLSTIKCKELHFSFNVLIVLYMIIR